MKRVPDKHKRHLDRHLDRWQRGLPRGLGSSLEWLRRPSVRWLRVPTGVLLIIGGLFGFLPILGFWMLIPGLALLAVDVPALRRPVHVVAVRTRHAARRLRRRWRTRQW